MKSSRGFTMRLEHGDAFLFHMLGSKLGIIEV